MSRKAELAVQAEKHTNEMRAKYSGAIESSVKNTKIYSPDSVFNVTSTIKGTEIIVEDLDTVSALNKHKGNGKTALLNFASYKNAGGGFLNGSRAQEEDLCHKSYLYNVLSKFTDTYYAWNNEHKNKGLYLNRALYSPSILFEDKTYCDVITCASPNRSIFKRYKTVSEEENEEVLRSRLKFILDIARENEVSTLILGAIGCGVFSQEPAMVANIFQEYLDTEYRCFDKVIFAVPQSKGSNNFKVFKEIFG